MDLFRRVVQHISYPSFNEVAEEKLPEQNTVIPAIIEESSNKDEIK